MKNLSSVLFLCLTFCLSSSAPAQTKPPARMQPGAKVYIAPMEGDLHTFLAAEIVKKKVPIVVVVEEEEADFVMTGGNFKTGEGKWFDVMFGAVKDKNEGSVQLISVAQRALVWAGEAGDRSLWWGALARGGTRKVAGRIIGRLKHDFDKGINLPLDTGLPASREPITRRESLAIRSSAEPPRPEAPSTAQPQAQPSRKRICSENGSRVPCPEDKPPIK
jgi:hypothetical protein